MSTNGNDPAAGVQNVAIKPEDVNVFMKAFPDAAKDLLNIALFRELRERDAMIATLQNGSQMEEPVKA